MRPYILSETHWSDIKEQEYKLAILPWGACEAHNYHLPYGTDNYETEALVFEAARLAWENTSDTVAIRIDSTVSFFIIAPPVLKPRINPRVLLVLQRQFYDDRRRTAI